MIKGLAHPKGSTRSGHSCNVINDVHPSKRDGGKIASEGHKKWNFWIFFYKCMQTMKCVLDLSIRKTTQCNGVPCTLKNAAKWVPDQVSICDELLG